MAVTYVQIPVPEHRVEEVMRFLLDGESRPASRRVQRRTVVEGFDPTRNERYPDLATMSDEQVREAYLEGSVLQRRIWEELAQEPGKPITWSELSDRLEVSRHAVPGSIKQFLDRAKERYEEKRPHHEAKSVEHNQWWIWLDERVARIIREVANDE